ncbi:MAG TPA: DUF748 domain-containing protein [Candidatus Binatia bacterium]|jgi:hypothetical protein
MKRWGIIICAVIFLFAAGTVVGFRMAVRTLKDKVVAALGSGSKVAELNVGWNSVELRGIEIAGPKDWPVRRTLYAERVTIVPSLASLLTQQVQISSVTVEQPYLSLVRAPGKLILLPSLLGTGERKDRRNERAVTIFRIVVQGGVDAVDLVSLQPYLVKKGEARVDRGTLDLNVRSEVRNSRLDGKGRAVIRDLGFAPPRGYMKIFMGLPRNAVVGFLKDHQGAIDVDFTLHGDISHPNFSLNESLANRVATGMAEQLGVTVKGMATGIGTLGREGVESAGKITDAIGSAIRDIFGDQKR